MTRSIVYGANVDIDMGANPITNVEDPTNDQDAATKKYVDDNAGSISVTDGSTTVDPATSLAFTSGATVTDGGSGIAEVAVTSSFDLPGTIHAATGKTTPVDNDELALVDSAASNVLKKLLWSNVKATLKTYFDTLYASTSGSAPIGTPELIYRYTVTGSDKSSIDTGVDTPDAGSNDWTNGDLLEIFIVSRTDTATFFDTLGLTFNNDTAANYGYQVARAANTTASAVYNNGLTSLQIPGAHGGAAETGTASSHEVKVPGYARTVFNKTATILNAAPDGTSSGASIVEAEAGLWKSTAAITRVAIASTTGGKKLKVGSQLLVYKRRAS